MNTRARLQLLRRGPLILRAAAPLQGRYEVRFKRGGAGTHLAVKLVQDDEVEMQQIAVEPELRGLGIAEAMVALVANEFPGRRLWFSGTNGWSRRLARKIDAGGRIQHFDPDQQVQDARAAEDTAAGFYGPTPPPIPTFDEVIDRMRRAQSDPPPAN